MNGVKSPPTCFLANPHSRYGRSLYQAGKKRLGALCDVRDWVMPNDPAAFRSAIRHGLSQGVQWFVVAGGDGTLALAAEELMERSAVMIPLPAGTGNTFAWSLKLPREWKRWESMVRRAWVREFDLGVVQAQGQQRVFLNTATVGVTSTLIDLVNERDKRRYGLAAWVVHLRNAMERAPILESFLINPQGGGDHFYTRQIVVVNGKGLAGPLASGPNSESGRDGALEIFALGDPTAASMIRVAARVLVSRHRQDPTAHYQRARTFDLYTRPALTIDLDGEAWQSTPARFSVKPLALRVMVPPPI